MFLEQYWGGPTTYSQERGHPRLRMRHAPFPVTPALRDRWLTHMRDAVDSLDINPTQRSELWSYMERAAYSMVNTGRGATARARAMAPSFQARSASVVARYARRPGS